MVNRLRGPEVRVIGVPTPLLDGDGGCPPPMLVGQEATRPESAAECHLIVTKQNEGCPELLWRGHPASCNADTHMLVPNQGPQTSGCKKARTPPIHIDLWGDLKWWLDLKCSS